MMKNVFYFTSKAILVFKIFEFLSWFFGHVAKWVDKKDKANFKFYDVTAWLTNSCKHILPNMASSKGTQRKKFGQLIECNMRKIFTENVMEKLIPDLFLKN